MPETTPGPFPCCKPLGSKMGYDLAGLLKTRLRDDGIRAVCKPEEADGVMRAVIVGMRADAEVYRQASARREKHGL